MEGEIIMTVEEYDKLNARLDRYTSLHHDIENAEEMVKDLEYFYNTYHDSKENINFCIKATYYPTDCLTNPDSNPEELEFQEKSNTFFSSSGQLLVEAMKKYVDELKKQIDEL